MTPDPEVFSIFRRTNVACLRWGSRRLAGDLRRRSAFMRIALLVLFALASAQGSLQGFAQSTAQVETPHAKAPAGSAAQQAPKTAQVVLDNLASYEGQNVTGVELAGQPGLDPAQYLPLFAQKTGEPFAKAKVEQTVAAMKATGKFKEVQLQIQPEGKGVRILMILEPAIYFGIFEFPGAERFAYSRLVQIANFPPEAPYNANDIEADRQNLLKFFRQEGYFQAEIAPETKLDPEHRLANVFFHVTLKHAAKFGTVQIADATPEQAAKLDHDLQTLLARARGVGIRPGKTYHYSNITKAATYLQGKLAKEGRLSAQVKLEGADYHADTNRADIHFSVKVGPVTHVEVDGAKLFPWTRKSLLPVYQGIGVDDESVQEGRQGLLSYFQAKGFFDAQVDAELTQKDGVDSVVYKVTKDKKHKVNSVTLSGNSLVPSSELVSRLTVEKKHLFSPGNYSQKLVRASVKNLKTVYESEGFSSAKVVSTVDRKGGDINVAFRVEEGPRDTVSSLTIEGADTFPQSKFAPGGLKLGVGKPYSQALVEADRAAIGANYLKAGYLTSSFRQTATVVSKNDPHHIDVIYHIMEGPQVFAGDVVTLGRDRTQQRLINEDVASIHPGEPLTETELLISESKLYNHTGVFDWAEVDPKREITTQTKEDVLVKVHEAPRNTMTYGFGFELINRGGSIPGGTIAVPGLPPVGLPTNFATSQETFYGPRGTFQYTRNNFRGKGETVSVTGFAGRLDQRGAAYYINPNLRWSPWKATTSFSAERNEENPIFSSQQEVGSLQVQRSVFAKKEDTLFLRYSFSKTDLTRILIQELVLPADQHVRLSTIAANFTRDTRDNPLDEHKGMLDSAELDFNTTKLGSSVDFAKFTGQAAYYKPIGNFVWASSLRVGLAQPFGNSRVPISEAYFTGGGNTLRGFPLDGAGPQRAVCISASSGCPAGSQFIQVPEGGNELLIINEEARIPLTFRKGLGIVAFYDGGNVFPTVGFHDFKSLYSNTVGVGLRYATPVGPVRIDLGRNLNPGLDTGVSATQYFISIGQAF